MSDISHVGAVVLAAGKGTRLGCTDKPKVMLELFGKPMIAYTVETFESLGLSPKQIVLVVGFQKERVMEYFGDRVTYAVQEQQKGTGHAAFVGMRALPADCDTALVMGGDDSAFYTTKTLKQFITQHKDSGGVLSLLSTHIDDPSSLGRVVRHEGGLIEIIEKELLTEEQKQINEISTGTFCLDTTWYKSIFPDMEPMKKLGEYGLPTAFTMARDSGRGYQVVVLEHAQEWCGVNTPDELETAQERKTKQGVLSR